MAIIDDLSAYRRPITKPEPPITATNSTLAAATVKLPPADEMTASLRKAASLAARSPPSGLLGFDSITMRTVSHPLSFRIVEDPHMTDTVEDWSEVRAPSRAARRRRQGHRQRIRWVERPKPDIYHVGDMLVMHPETARVFRAKVAAAGDAMIKRAERELFGAVLDSPLPRSTTTAQES